MKKYSVYYDADTDPDNPGYVGLCHDPETQTTLDTVALSATTPCEAVDETASYFNISRDVIQVEYPESHLNERRCADCGSPLDELNNCTCRFCDNKSGRQKLSYFI